MKNPARLARRAAAFQLFTAFSCWLAGTILPAATWCALLGEKPRKVKF